jgi:electron transport complex protein RnfC
MLDYLPKGRHVGGVRLDPAKAVSTLTPIRHADVPPKLYIPINSGHENLAALSVRIGDTVLRGQTVADGPPDCGMPAAHASSSGTVSAIVERLGVFGDDTRVFTCIEIETDGNDTPCALSVPERGRAPGYEAIRAAGIVGLGGAGFSSAAKLRNTRACRTLIVNGAECEPYISCDDMLMREAAAEIIAGCVELTELIGAGTCIVAIERDKTQAIASIRAAAIALDDPRIAIAEIPSVYPAGGERQLIELLQATEVPSGEYPSDVGVLCHNVGTTLAIHRALRTGQPLVDRVVTVTGKGVASPCNALVRIGTPIADVIEFCGGYTHDAAYLIVGGSMMGVSLPHDDVIVTKTTNCIIVASEDEFSAAEREWPCIRCGECASACPARLLPQELVRAAQSERFDELETFGLDDCIACGCCDIVCPSHIPLTSQFRVAKTALAARRREAQFAASAQARFDARAARLRLREDAERTAHADLLAKLEDNASAKDEIAAAVARSRKRKQTQDADT